MERCEQLQEKSEAKERPLKGEGARVDVVMEGGREGSFQAERAAACSGVEFRAVELEQPRPKYLPDFELKERETAREGGSLPRLSRFGGTGLLDL